MDRILALVLASGVFMTSCRKEASAPNVPQDDATQHNACPGGEALSGPADVIDESSIPPQQKLLADPGLTGPGPCQFHYYCCNQETGVPAPPGHVWRYCVCQQRDYNDPVSLNLEGGWTYPAWNCTQDWSEY